MMSVSHEPSDGSSQLPQGDVQPANSQPPTQVVTGSTADAMPQTTSPAETPEAAARRIKIGSQRAPDVAIMARRQTKPVVIPPVAPQQPVGAAGAAVEESPRVQQVAAPPSSPPPQVDAEEPAAEPAQVEPVELPQPSRRRNIAHETVETRHIPPPNIRAELPPEWEREVEEALGGMSVDELLSKSTATSAAATELAPETACQGRIVSLHRDNVFVDLAQRHQGVLSLRQFVEPPQAGAILNVQVVRFDPEEGLYQLTLPGAAIDVSNWADVSEGMVVQARVTGHNKGGLECEVNSLRGFIPASQVSMYRVEDLSTCVGESFPCVVTEANPEKRNLVLSRRAVLERESAEARKTLLAELEPGAIREGTVRRVQDFGAFVDLGGVDGLVHVSQLAWNRVKHPSEVVAVGQRVTVRVQKIDPDSGKISLSMKELADNPWNTVAERYSAKSNHAGKVSKLMDFGAFVELEPGVEGLIHISELDYKRVFRVKDVLSEGDEVDVQVLSVDVPSRRIALSRKALLARAEPVRRPEPEEPEPVAARKPPKVPLKGGRGQTTGGEQFGLKW